jgi:Alpha amylase, catalytic domain
MIYEVNTAVWLEERSRAAGRRVTLGDVSPDDWRSVTPTGVDAVWLMGVWERSPVGLAVATSNSELQASWAQALPDLRPEDVIGSPYCVRRYEVDPAFGGPEGLAAARADLADGGVRLLLDYVPNHVAPDHPWTKEHPDRFVRGSTGELESDPTAWIRIGDQILARGRDPYFPPWPDVVQLDAFSPALRAATAATLTDIADQCDGIRCDMAMLMTNEVFARTWGGRTGAPPAEDFWPAVIAQLRRRHPETVLLAETYWDMEWVLQQQGFDFCYDKRLYDRIVAGDPDATRAHLTGDLDYQAHLMRFLENHDEPRIADRLDPDAARAAALAITTLPGATLWHEGQFEGRQVRPPVFLQRRPDEPVDRQLSAWYQTLLAAVAQHGVRQGQWHLLEVTGWPDNQSCRNLLAWSWTHAERHHLVVINFSGAPAQGRVAVGWPDLGRHQWQLADLLQPVRFDRDGGELEDEGLFVALEPWQSHLLEVT